MKTIFQNGTILTMDDACPQAEAMLVQDGKILRVGSNAEIAQENTEGTRCVDLQGRTVLPGFLDGHSHFAGLAMSLSQCDLSQAKDFADICKLLKAFIRENQIPAGEWVTGTNYDHNFLAEKAHPDKLLLDSVSTEHPIVIVHASSHMGVVNSLGLQLQNLNADTPDPVGGHYGRMEGSQELSGYMEENAFVMLRNSMPMPDIASILALFQKAQGIYASYGITTVQEGMVTKPLLQLLQLAQMQNVLYLDIAGYLDLATCADLLPGKPGYQNHLRMAGFKTFLDGSPQGRTAWMQQPYADAEDGYCGYPIRTDEELYQQILTALEKGQQLLAHCNGDAAAEQYVTQFARVLSDHPELEAHRPVMIHAQLVRPEQLERMRKISMMPSFFVAHTYYWGDIHVQNFGMERAATISPAGTALALGLPFTFHQDSPVLLPNVLESIWCAAKRVTRTGTALAQTECVPVLEGLKAATVYAAYQYGEEAEKGTLTAGKRADFVVLEHNPLELPLDAVKDVRVLETYKDGVCVYHR